MSRSDALSVLKRDHRSLQTLFRRFDHAANLHHTPLMAAIARDIVKELEQHCAMDEGLFYPAVAAWLPRLRERVGEQFEEHRTMRFLLNTVKSVGAHDPRFVARMHIFREIVSHHVDQEESDLFPQMRDSLRGAWLRALGRQIESTRMQARPEAELADVARQRVEPLPELGRKRPRTAAVHVT